MEAIAGLSLAANILQVIDFTANVLLAGHQIHKSGSTAQNAELELVTKDFVELNDRLKSWARPEAASSGPLEKDSQVHVLRHFFMVALTRSSASRKPGHRERGNCTRADRIAPVFSHSRNTFQV
jgi:hypothetical protein